MCRTTFLKALNSLSENFLHSYKESNAHQVKLEDLKKLDNHELTLIRIATEIHSVKLSDLLDVINKNITSNLINGKILQKHKKVIQLLQTKQGTFIIHLILLFLIKSEQLIIKDCDVIEKGENWNFEEEATLKDALQFLNKIKNRETKDHTGLFVFKVDNKPFIDLYIDMSEKYEKELAQAYLKYQKTQELMELVDVEQKNVRKIGRAHV